MDVPFGSHFLFFCKNSQTFTIMIHYIHKPFQPFILGYFISAKKNILLMNSFAYLGYELFVDFYEKNDLNACVD